MSNLIVCPSCKKGLRTSAPVPAGKKIRCPACTQVFVTAAAPVEAIQAKAAPVRMAAPARPSAPTGTPPARPAPVLQAKAAPVPLDDVEEVDDDFDEPRPRRRRDRDDDPPVVRRRTGSKLGLILGLSGGFALLLVLSLTAFVWPGFLVGGRPASQARTLLAFVPPNSTVVGGAQVGLFRKQAEFQQNWNDFQQKIAQVPDFPPEARELLNDADEVVVAGSGDLQGSAVFVASTERPYDVEKIKRLAKAGPPVQVQGQALFPTNNLINGKQSFLALPTDKIMVLGVMPQEEFAKVLAGAATAKLHPDLQEQVDHAHSGLVWMAARFDDTVKQQLGQANAQLGPAAIMFGADLPNILGAVQRGKGALLSIDVGGDKLKVSVGVTCKDGGDAGTLKTGVSNFWNAQAPQIAGMGQMADAFVPGAGNVLGEVQRSFTLEQRGSTVIASVEVNQATLNQLANALQNNPFMGGLPGAPRGIAPPPGFGQPPLPKGNLPRLPKMKR